MRRAVIAIRLAAALSILLVPAAFAQAPANSFPCPADITGAPLATIPEIQAVDHMLSGTLYTVSEQQRFTAASKTNTPYCYPQWVRAYRRSAPTNWNPPSSQISNPMPGPTLRARVGDIVALTFLNVIDATKFPGSDDNKCDETGTGGSVYPGTNTSTTTADVYPDCFAGSVFTNVHYHGTHTNPNTTGDNVFLQIRPSPRKTDGTNAPVVTAQSVKPAFDEFFSRCRAELIDATGPKMWPRLWGDLPQSTQQVLMEPLKQYAPEWWTWDQQLIAQGNFPQYFVSAFPYCFKLPQKKAAAEATAANQPAALTPHTHGAGSAEVDEAKAPSRPLLMGQAPGTHWYHAHKHGSTTINVMNGMTGAFVIEGEYDDAINAYYGTDWTKKQPVMVIQQLGPAPGLQTGTPSGPGPEFSVNGQLRPVVTMAGNSMAMWRIANTSGRAGAYFLKPTGIQWKQIAQDGVQFKKFGPLNDEFLLMSGNRADLLVQAPAFDTSAGATNTYNVLVYNTVDSSDRPPQKPNAASATLLTVKVTANDPNTKGFMPTPPPFPEFLSDITDAEISGTKVIKFASSAIAPVVGTKFPSQHTIDGKKFDGELGVVVALNHAEEWQIVNETYPPANANQISHPFHIHINPFQVTSVFDPNAVWKTTDGTSTINVTSITPNPPATTPPAGDQATVSRASGSAPFSSEFRVGDWIWVKSKVGDKAMGPAMVAAIDDTANTMTINNQPPAALTGATYTAVIPLYTINKTNPRPGQCVIDPLDTATWKPCTPTEPPVDRIWWDVFAIPSGSTFTDGTTTYQIPGYFKMRSRFVDFSGYYVIHCHILAHEDRGMMTVVEVAPLQTPYSHH